MLVLAIIRKNLKGRKTENPKGRETVKQKIRKAVNPIDLEELIRGIVRVFASREENYDTNYLNNYLFQVLP
jgi:hypothetical protein